MATTQRTTPKTKKPVAHFSISQAEKERDEGEQIEPFTVELSEGEVITFKNPDDLDWQVAASVTEASPFLFLQEALEESDYEKFVAERFSIGTMKKLVTAYRDHYGMLDSGN